MSSTDQVAEIEQGRNEAVPGMVGESSGQPDQGHHQQVEPQCRKEPQRAAPIEKTQGDASRALFFAKQNVGDQKTAQDKKNRYPGVARDQPNGRQMREGSIDDDVRKENKQDGQGPNAVEAGDVTVRRLLREFDSHPRSSDHFANRMKQIGHVWLARIEAGQIM